jgi:hypothetical protein
MTKLLSSTRQLLLFGIPLGMFVSLVFLIKSPNLPIDSDLVTLALTIDLIISVPFIYFLLIRKTTIPKTTVVPMMILGLTLGSIFLPKEHQAYLELFKTWVLPIIELSIFTFIFIKIRAILKKYKAEKLENPDFFSTIKTICSEILPPKTVILFATEVAVLYYGFIHWKSRKLVAHEYSYHKRSGTPALLWILILLILVETFSLHLLLLKWSPLLAWVLFIFSIYSAVQILGFAKSLTQRPIKVEKNRVLLRYGILNEVEIFLSDIISIDALEYSPQKEEGLKSLSPLGEMEKPNVQITLSKEYTASGFYGKKSKFKILVLHVDEDSEFIAEIQHNLGT